ncbi:hypothetical protein H0E87_009221 [Populus deltoides]|uniref:Uncharacterized protein n=1 Tax=Populus deltoides TaxID=3696 RepID=A0A8T2Z3R6_POPDE|nr:hypothetical protein H0E87_009221 [Populus deltoides]
MAPIYAADSYMGLLDIQGSKAFFMFLDSVKECYEALVIAKFLALMYSYLKISISKNIVPDEVKGREIHHSFPMTLFVVNILPILFQLLVKGVFLALDANQTLEGSKSTKGAPKNLKQTNQISLSPDRIDKRRVCAPPDHMGLQLPSEFCLQHFAGIVLDMLVSAGIIRSHHFWLDVEHIEEAFQNVLVILEMVVFSVLQQYAYHVAPYSGELLWLDGHAEEDIINVAVLSILYNFVDDYQKLQCKKLGRLRIGLFESSVEEKVENGYSLGDFKNLKIFDYSN